ncbi:MAG: DUF1353 domain-containing protein [Gammaproteobacteria bacterium]
MTDTHIKYRSGYKYQLAEDYSISTSIKPAKKVKTQFIDLDKNGKLVVKSGYAWDGTSGPVKDTPRNLRASLVHDAFYQLMRQEHLKADEHKDKADRLFQKMCKQDGTPSATAKVYYEALKLAGKPATDPSNAKKVFVAPRDETLADSDPLAGFDS